MKDLRSHVREVELLENKAADKAGVRFLVMSELELLKSGRQAYIKKFIDLLLRDIEPEVIAAAKLGRELNAAVTGK